MKKTITAVFLVSIIAVAGCSTKDWAQADRDKIINSCIDEAKKGSSAISDSALKKYCTCYQQSLEQKYPDKSKLDKGQKDEAIKLAEGCAQLLIK